MAAPNFLPGAAWVKLYWNLSGALGINVLGMRVTGSPVFDQALANSVGADIKTAYSTHLGAHMAPSGGLTRVGIRDWRTPNQPEYRDTGAGVVGSAPTATDMLPPQVALCVTFRTALTGKSQTGRSYIGGWAEGDNTSAGVQLDIAGQAAIAFFGAVQTALVGRGLTMAVISRPAEEFTIVKTTFHSNGTTTSDTLSHNKQKSGAINDVEAFESRSTQWETQRRRANGRGQVASFISPPALLRV